MFSKRSTTIVKQIPDYYLYIMFICGLLLVTSVALAMDRHWVGILGLLSLSVASLCYGAIQTPEDLSS